MTDSILKVIQILEIDIPSPKTDKVFNSPSDYLGENFVLSETMSEKVRKLCKMTKASFERYYAAFERRYYLQKHLRHNATDLNIYFCDFILFAAKNGYAIIDYFNFEFYNKDLALQNNFVGGRFRQINNRIGNDRMHMRELRIKTMCNKIFYQFIHRDWIGAKESTLSDFKKFIAEHPRFFAKQNTGGGGEGARIIQIDSESNVEEIFSELQKSDMVLEEILVQNEKIRSFCPDTLNTIRINTFRDEHDFVHLVVASGRFGRMGQVTDNYHTGGFAVVINPENGRIISDGLNMAHERSKVHPDTGKVFKNFKYPFWIKIRKAVIKMAKLVPHIRHVGWDVTINSNDEVELVEANDLPGSAVYQAADSVGKLNFYKPLIEEFKKYRQMPRELLGYRINDIRRFNSVYDSYSEKRDEKVKFALRKLAAGCESLLDLGCRKNKFAKTLCPQGVQYFPADFQKYDDEVIACNFHRGEFPKIQVDTCLCVMIAEQVKKLPTFLENICAAAKKQILILCRPIDKESSPLERWENPTVADFTENFLINSIKEKNFALDSVNKFPANPSFILYDFRKVETENKIPLEKNLAPESEEKSKTLPDMILKTCEFLGLTVPGGKLLDTKSDPEPSDYFGKDFELTLDLMEKVRVACNRRKDNFARIYGEFTRNYFDRKLDHNETNLNIYFCDYIMFCRNKGMTSIVDYFDFEFYRLPAAVRSTFRLQGHRAQTRFICNDYDASKLLNNKSKTNRIFAEFIHRDWINAYRCSFETFKDFVGKHKKFFVKPVVGSLGNNTSIFELSPDENLEELFQKFKEEIMLLEEVVTQHEIMKSFCPDTVNTLRINTFLDIHNVVHILAASGRFGRLNTIVDNYSSNGYTVTIDPKTGIIISDGINKHHERSKVHPDTGKVFKGFQYPFWNKVRLAVMKMAKLIPTVHHIGWDIAINSEGNVELIEANSNPDVHVQQSADLTGRLHLYQPLIDEYDAWKKTTIDYLGYRINNLKSFLANYNSYAELHDIGVKFALEKLIPKCASLIELGCRKNLFAASLLPEGVKYHPFDFRRHDPETVVCDFNRNKFPKIKADTFLCALIAEFVAPLPSFLEKVCAAAEKQVLMVCRPFDKETSIKFRWEHTVLTDFTEKFLIETMRKNNFELNSRQAVPKNDALIMYDFRKNLS